jgi:16S rRNA (cytidine1402-2'-O)-methyltransferase
MGTLYLVSTPIGNISDISKRAVDILSKVSYILCEDTRHSGQLLSTLHIKTPVRSFYEQNEIRQIPQIISDLHNDMHIALISDAGTPTISDPGFKLVRQCKENGISVVAIPGASAVLCSLVSSGLPTDSFLFLGYLPEKSGHREKKLQNLKHITPFLSTTFCFYIPPHDVLKILSSMLSIYSDIDIVIARELTKIHEDVRKQKISLWINEFKLQKPKGEITLLFHSSELT